jgi:transcriptional regulator with XRE-family HTH domain
MQESFQMQIASRIAQAIEQAGFKTQDEFARVIDMDRSTLRRVLSGKFDPKLSTLQRIAVGLELSVDELLTTKVGESALLLKKKGRRSVEVAPIVQIQFTLPPGEQLPDWLKDAVQAGKATASLVMQGQGNKRPA